MGKTHNTSASTYYYAYGHPEAVRDHEAFLGDEPVADIKPAEDLAQYIINNSIIVPAETPITVVEYPGYFITPGIDHSDVTDRVNKVLGKH